MSARKAPSAVFAFLLLFIIAKTSVFGQATGERILEFSQTSQIRGDGTVAVSEKIVYDFGARSRHGIYRDIPFIKKNLSGEKFRLDFSGVSVADEKGGPYRFETSESGEGMRIKIGDPDKYVSGIKTYVISYRVSGALTYFSDHDEFYWNVTGNDWEVPIEKAESEVILPQGFSSLHEVDSCYTGIYGSKEQNCSKAVLGSRTIFATHDALLPGSGFTIAVGFPKGVAAVLEPAKFVPFTDTLLGKIIAALFVLALLFWYILLPLLLALLWFMRGRDPQVDAPVTAWYDPPKNSSGRPLTPAETGTLVDESADLPDISGTLVNLAQRGYFKISEQKNDDFHFVKRKDFESDPALQPFEKYLLERLFSRSDDVRVKDKSLYLAIETTKDMIYKSLVDEGFFPKNPKTIRALFTVMVIPALFTLNFPLVLSTLVFGRNLPRKSVAGAKAASVAKGLKNFLASQERQLEFQAKNQMMFEKLLPYAIVFGVEKIWAERFADLPMAPPDWYESYDTSVWSSVIWTNHLNSSFSSVRAASSPPSSSSSGFGSGGGGGGSSGGGGGGGGGGSW